MRLVRSKLVRTNRSNTFLGQSYRAKMVLGLIEIFRDDTKKSREVTTYDKDIPLEVVEASIGLFKKEIPGISKISSLEI